MVEKGHPSHDDDTPMLGMAMPTPGLESLLDQEREASMADEGGASGAVMESQEADVVREPPSLRDVAKPHASETERATRRDSNILAAICLGGVALMLLGRRLLRVRRRER